MVLDMTKQGIHHGMQQGDAAAVTSELADRLVKMS